MPVNSNQIYPLPASDNLNVSAFNFTQFLSPYLGVTPGKYATITSTSGDMNEFAQGKGDAQFMNFAILRPYDPNEAAINKSWKPCDIQKMK
jgi:hypothetical protein